MPKFVIEREMPGIGAWSAGQLQLIKEHVTRGGFPCNRVSEVRG